MGEGVHVSPVSKLLTFSPGQSLKFILSSGLCYWQRAFPHSTDVMEAKIIQVGQHIPIIKQKVPETSCRQISCA